MAITMTKGSEMALSFPPLSLPPIAGPEVEAGPELYSSAACSCMHNRDDS
jgi:hypothetical protein